MKSGRTTSTLPGRPVGYVNRFLGVLLEYVLFSLTFSIGWFVWFIIASKRGETPAKQLMRVRIHDYRTGAIASRGQVYQRELFGKIAVPILLMLFGFLTADTFLGFFVVVELLHSVGFVIIFFTRDRRALWDFHANTVVRQHAKDPAADARPVVLDLEAERRELERLWGDGAITSEEYSTRLRDLRVLEARTSDV